MIIRAPTALYRPILPGPNEPGNITFTISNNNPPRSVESFIQLPLSDELKKQPVPTFNKEQKRIFAGEFVYDIIKPSTSRSGSGSRQYEVGEILNFDDDVEIDSDPYNLEVIELRQDLKSIDYELFGLSDSDIEQLISESLKKFNELTVRISAVGSSLKDNSSLISKNQADINNTSHVLDNIIAVFNDDHPSAVIVKNKLDNLLEDKKGLFDNRLLLQSELDELRNQINKVREVVR